MNQTESHQVGRGAMTHPRISPGRRLAAAILTAGLLTFAPPASALTDPGQELHSLQHVRATGSVHSGDGRLERGCQTHGYRYRVRPGNSDWSLELFLVGPRGKQVATGYEWKGNEDRKSTRLNSSHANIS